MKNLIVIVLLITGMVSVQFAQEIEPRAYTNVPAGLNAAAFAYSLSSGNILTDPTLPLQDLNVTTHIPTIIYLRTFNIFGKLGRAQVMIPYAFLAGDAKLAGIDTSGTRRGFADARIRLGVNIFGSPALSLKEFQRFQQTTIFGASVVVSVPIGQYDNTKLINLGSNRWGIKPEIGFSHQHHRLYFEMYAGIWFSTKNLDFLQTLTLEQEPIFSFQWHVGYIFKSGIWLAIDGAHVNGGKTKIDGVYSDSFQRNWRLGGSLSVPLGRQHSIKVLYHSGIWTRFGGDFDIFTLAYQYIWF